MGFGCALVISYFVGSPEADVLIGGFDNKNARTAAGQFADRRAEDTLPAGTKARSRFGMGKIASETWPWIGRRTQPDLLGRKSLDEDHGALTMRALP